MTTILEIMKMKPVKVYASGHGEGHKLANPDQIIGLELEIENWGMDRANAFGGFTFTTDGSLRNSGIEAISQPIRAGHVEALLRAFYKQFQITAENYSERCSLHVHVNVQDMSPEELAVVCLAYQTAERLLFKFIGNGRADSIFCVPWNQSETNYKLVNQLLSSTYYAARRWQKYSALNLLPITGQGTIEFRHLHGTCDVTLIMTWINLISSLMNYGRRVPLKDAKQEIMRMNTVSNYRMWLEEVFKEFAFHLLAIQNYEIDLERGVIDSKYMLMENDNDKVVDENPEEPQATLRFTDPPRYAPDDFEEEDFPRTVDEQRVQIRNAIAGAGVLRDRPEALFHEEINWAEQIRQGNGTGGWDAVRANPAIQNPPPINADWLNLRNDRARPAPRRVVPNPQPPRRRT